MQFAIVYRRHRLVQCHLQIIIENIIETWYTIGAVEIISFLLQVWKRLQM